MNNDLGNDENGNRFSHLVGFNDRFGSIFNAVSHGIFIISPDSGWFIEINHSTVASLATTRPR